MAAPAVLATPFALPAVPGQVALLSIGDWGINYDFSVNKIEHDPPNGYGMYQSKCS